MKNTTQEMKKETFDQETSRHVSAEKMDNSGSSKTSSGAADKSSNKKPTVNRTPANADNLCGIDGEPLGDMRHDVKAENANANASAENDPRVVHELTADNFFKLGKFRI